VKLKDLFEAIPAAFEPRLVGGPETAVDSLAYDSRQVFNGVGFVCLKGEKSDGHNFRLDSAHRGASAFVIDRNRSGDFADMGLPYVSVTNTRSALPYIAAAFYQYPTHSFELIGITGTNGKTTCAFMVSSIWRAAGEKTGVIGAIGAFVDGQSFPTTWTVSTTPESLDLQQFFAQLRREHVLHAALEVTSIAIDQRRTDACDFDTAIFTNLTQDHLDYHGTMEAYEAAKAKLFLDYATTGDADFIAVLNLDDPAGQRLSARTSERGTRTVGYGIEHKNSDFKAEKIVTSANGTVFQVNERGGERYSITLPIGGLYNVSNALGAIAATRSRGVPIDTIQRGLANLPQVPGRFESVDSVGRDFHIIVDYAHTPDGLENVLKSARALTLNRLVVVFGCGGNRDRPKRPKMGKIAAEIADIVVVTSDNPRNEDPEFIVSEIVDGIENGRDRQNVHIIVDRREAIRFAICEIASPGDLIVIAGKGHETYQLVKGETFPFDDRLVAAEALASCS
jgi:UDP-N-acetylmuramoyl-L-alanyl-D-glutamate--2,6-diaminopimelate ligase